MRSKPWPNNDELPAQQYKMQTLGSPLLCWRYLWRIFPKLTRRTKYWTPRRVPRLSPFSPVHRVPLLSSPSSIVRGWRTLRRSAQCGCQMRALVLALKRMYPQYFRRGRAWFHTLPDRTAWNARRRHFIATHYTNSCPLQAQCFIDPISTPIC